MLFASILTDLLPWLLGGVMICGGLILGVKLLIGFAQRAFQAQFEKVVGEVASNFGANLRGATVEVHEVQAVPTPEGKSPYDPDEDDEDFCEDLDREPWGDEGVNYYSIDATITPADPTVRWDPTGLALAPGDYVPEEPGEISEQMCPLFSAEVYLNNRFVKCPERGFKGPQRARMVFAVHEGLRDVQFANFVTLFGHVKLPKPLAKAGAKETSKAKTAPKKKMPFSFD